MRPSPVGPAEEPAYPLLVNTDPPRGSPTRHGCSHLHGTLAPTEPRNGGRGAADPNNLRRRPPRPTMRVGKLIGVQHLDVLLAA